MSTMLLVSHLALWVFLVLLSVAVLLMVRQVGLLHLRIAPVGARVMSVGPEIGRAAPPITLVDIDDPSRTFRVSEAMDTDLLLMVISPACAVCGELMPSIKPLARESDGALRWVIVGSGGRERCRNFRQRNGLDYLLFAYSPKLRKRYGIGPTPYALLIHRDGTVVSKGLVNHIEHVESLLEVRNQSVTADETENDADIGVRILRRAQPVRLEDV